MHLDPEIRKKLKLPEVSQVGVVVRDLDEAIGYYEKNLGLGPFLRLDISFSDKTYRGKPANSSKWIMAFASLGPVELELIQPIAGPTLYHEFLEYSSAGGIHHLGFDVKDMDERIQLYKEIGIEVIQSGRTPVGGFAYLDTAKIGGVIFELIQRQARRA